MVKKNNSNLWQEVRTIRVRISNAMSATTSIILDDSVVSQHKFKPEIPNTLNKYHIILNSYDLYVHHQFHQLKHNFHEI